MARITLPGRAKMRWLASEPAAPTAPTAAEIAAGVDLIGTGQAEALAEIQGLILNSTTIPTPDYTSHQVGNVPGDETIADSRLSFYKDDTIETIYTTLVKGTAGFLAVMYDGESVGEEVKVYPATVQSNERRPDRDAANIFDVPLSTSIPYVGTIAA